MAEVVNEAVNVRFLLRILSGYGILMQNINEYKQNASYRRKRREAEDRTEIS